MFVFRTDGLVYLMRLYMVGGQVNAANVNLPFFSLLLFVLRSDLLYVILLLGTLPHGVQIWPRSWCGLYGGGLGSVFLSQV